MKLDHDDLQTFMYFLQIHNPFVIDNSQHLVNIVTGLIADECVNFEEAIIAGQKIHDSMTNVIWEIHTKDRQLQS